MKNQTKNLIENYLNLPLEDKKISCPYFNNKKNNSRAGLRVLVGKGLAKEIVEETKILALKQKINLNNINDEDLKKFLVENNLGIDCSGFVYHILKSENKNLKLYYPQAKFLFRKLLIKLRPAENTSVKVIDHKKNSTKINLKEAEENNFIISLNGGTQKNYNHIIYIENILKENDKIKQINYIHSFKWPEDGQYKHGVRRGKIKITDENKNILEQDWIEQNKTGNENWTLKYLKTAEQIKIKKLVN